MTASQSDIRFRSIDGSNALYVDHAGNFFKAAEDLGLRLAKCQFTDHETTWLEDHGYISPSDLARHARTFTRYQRRTQPGPLSYLILVPTLRCNLACTYCQVSRVNDDAVGFDWSKDTLKAVKQILTDLDTPAVKIEFQGGEPTLRPDLIQAVIDAVPAGIDATFVVCTNLQHLSSEILEIFERGNVQISTSLDGDIETHRRQRIGDVGRTNRFAENLDVVLHRFGPEKVSALPTIDLVQPPDLGALIDAYASRGLRSIYLRPVNFHGFARKKHPESVSQAEAWSDFHRKFVKTLIERNWRSKDQILDEAYLTYILRRIFRPGVDSHVDLRNPNPVGRDYIVIDYDGSVYPSDEARMLSRSGIIDLAIGNVRNGWDTPERDALDAASTNLGDPVCDKCAYQPFCGRDLVDDLARYGTVALPRNETEFCKRHLALFDFAFELVYDQREAVQFSLWHWLGLSGHAIELGATL